VKKVFDQVLLDVFKDNKTEGGPWVFLYPKQRYMLKVCYMKRC